MTALYRWLIALLLTAAAVTVCYLWIDRPLALLAHAYSGHREVFATVTHLPDPLIPAACIVFVAVGLCTLGGRPLSAAKTTGKQSAVRMAQTFPARRAIAPSAGPGGCAS